MVVVVENAVEIDEIVVSIARHRCTRYSAVGPTFCMCREPETHETRAYIAFASPFLGKTWMKGLVSMPPWERVLVWRGSEGSQGRGPFGGGG